MALWGGLGQAATVAQLVGVDVGGLIFMIVQAAATARQNKKECQQLAGRVLLISEMLPQLQLQEAEVMRCRMAELDGVLREAHELVASSCQARSAAYRLVMAGRQADMFRDVQRRIDSCLLDFNIVSHINITRRFDGNYNVPNPSGGTTVTSTYAGPRYKFQIDWELPRTHGVQEFTLKELVAATNNFNSVIGRGGHATVYVGMLQDFREVAIKRANVFLHPDSEEEFRAEITILSQVRHKHIVGLLGWCAVDEDKGLPLVRKKKEKARLLVLEHMKNGSLFDHLHNLQWSSSPVRASWRMRIEILLGVSRAIEYLHDYAVQPIIHRDVKSNNVMLDDTWVPRLVDFGASLTWDEMECSNIVVSGTAGYIDPEYIETSRLRPTSDIYSSGVVMLEVLTGRKALDLNREDNARRLVHLALPLIEAGELRKLLDSRMATEPTPRELEAANLVAHTASRCLQFPGECRPAMSEVATNLKTALELVSGDGLESLSGDSTSFANANCL
ncbi:putative serine/threonine-protein kinase-like protein CCR3 [Oryza glaberrima]|uniref:Protein kinase domain-containing protein n=1 Tax=Oryza barthii TaxID=65489 RepID=A0A0D3HPQ2_9ORYZ|nr:putative serine/threonine-protein kinase-like protein CCR3 [Oryza glaberrima]